MSRIQSSRPSPWVCGAISLAGVLLPLSLCFPKMTRPTCLVRGWVVLRGTAYRALRTKWRATVFVAGFTFRNTVVEVREG